MAKTEKNEKKQKRFFKDFKAELKKVVWPTPKQVVNNTTAVVTIVLITALIVFVLDFTFESLNKYGINKIRTKVESSNSENIEDSNEVGETENNTATETQEANQEQLLENDEIDEASENMVQE